LQRTPKVCIRIFFSEEGDSDQILRYLFGGLLSASVIGSVGLILWTGVRKCTGRVSLFYVGIIWIIAFFLTSGLALLVHYQHDTSKTTCTILDATIISDEDPTRFRIHAKVSYRAGAIRYVSRTSSKWNFGSSPNSNLSQELQGFKTYCFYHLREKNKVCFDQPWEYEMSIFVLPSFSIVFLFMAVLTLKEACSSPPIIPTVAKPNENEDLLLKPPIKMLME